MSEADENKRADDLIRLKNDYITVFLGSPSGKRVLEDLLAISGYIENPHSMDPYESQFLCGKREMGRFLIEALDKSSYQGLTELQDAGLELTNLETGKKMEADNG